MERNNQTPPMPPTSPYRDGLNTTPPATTMSSSSSSVKIERKSSNVSQGSVDDKTAPRRVSISKASNLTVALSGGNPKTKSGTLRRKTNTLFSSYKECFVIVDDGDIIFQTSEDEVEKRETYSLLAIREVKLLGNSSCLFQLKFAEQTPPPISIGSSSSSLLTSWTEFAQQTRVKHMILKALSSKDALEWIAVIKHELKNQVLVCKNLFFTLQTEGHQDRAEPLFEQIMELLKVIYEGKEHFEVANTLRSYGKWLESQGRLDEAAQIKRQAKAMKRRCEEGLDIALARQSSTEAHKPSSPDTPIRRLSSLTKTFQNLKTTTI